MLTPKLAAVSALVATLVVVFGVTAVELGTGSSVIASGDRATTFFSPRDTTAPTTDGDPEATGTRIELHYDERLLAREIEGRDGFALSSGPTIVRVSIDGDLVLLHLSAEVTAATNVTLAYRGDTVVDEAGNPAASFRGLPVRVTPRPPRPLELRAVEGSPLLELAFDETLAPADESELLASLALLVDSRAVTPTAVSVDGERLLVSVAEPLAAGLRVSVTYPVGDARPLRDDVGNRVRAFQSSTTVAPDTTPPTAEHIELGDRGFKIVFDELLDENAALDPGTFLVRLADAETAVTGASVTGDTLVLELAEALAPGADVTVDYIGDALRDVAGNAVATGRLTEFTTPEAVQPPVLERAEFAPGESTVVLAYDVALDTSTVPESSSFSITVGTEHYTPSAVGFDSASTSVHLLLDELTAAALAQALIAEETASIGYVPGEAPITSAEGAAAPTFEAQPIELAGK